MYNYGSFFYRNGIYNIDSLEDRKNMKKAVNDARKIEEYFSKLIPNKTAIIQVILFSFILNKDLNYKDRINYIRGIIYCKKYIDIEDVIRFANNISSYSEPEEEKSIFFNKGYSESKFGFFYDAFDQNLYEYKDLANQIKKETFDIINNRKITDSKNNVSVEFIYSDEDDENMDEYNSEIDIEDYDSIYYNISEKEKLDNFKNNFQEFINIMLDKKNISKRKNNRDRVYIIKGMEDWFNYIISILDEIYEVYQIQKDYYSLDLSKFI